jgi:hypothetical protein
MGAQQVRGKPAGLGDLLPGAALQQELGLRCVQILL